MSIKNKNLGPNDRYNENDLNVTTESMIASKSNLGII
jgi:hypothetical protein